MIRDDAVSPSEQVMSEHMDNMSTDVSQNNEHFIVTNCYDIAVYCHVFPRDFFFITLCHSKLNWVFISFMFLYKILTLDERIGFNNVAFLVNMSIGRNRTTIGF